MTKEKSWHLCYKTIGCSNRKQHVPKFQQVETYLFPKPIFFFFFFWGGGGRLFIWIFDWAYKIWPTVGASHTVQVTGLLHDNDNEICPPARKYDLRWILKKLKKHHAKSNHNIPISAKVKIIFDLVLEKFSTEIKILVTITGTKCQE